VNLRGFLSLLLVGGPELRHPARKKTKNQRIAARGTTRAKKQQEVAARRPKRPRRGPKTSNRDGMVARTGRHPSYAEEAPRAPGPPPGGPKTARNGNQEPPQKNAQTTQKRTKKRTLNPTVNLRGLLSLLLLGGPELRHPARKNTEIQRIAARGTTRAKKPQEVPARRPKRPRRGPKTANHDGMVARTGRHPPYAGEAPRAPKDPSKPQKRRPTGHTKKTKKQQNKYVGQKRKTQNTPKKRP